MAMGHFFSPLELVQPLQPLASAWAGVAAGGALFQPRGIVSAQGHCFSPLEDAGALFQPSGDAWVGVACSAMLPMHDAWAATSPGSMGSAEDARPTIGALSSPLELDRWALSQPWEGAFFSPGALLQPSRKAQGPCVSTHARPRGFTSAPVKGKGVVSALMSRGVLHVRMNFKHIRQGLMNT